MAATTLSVVMRFHIGTKQPRKGSAPKKNMVVYLKGFHESGLVGAAWRPMYHACQGTTVERQGTCPVSQTCATGLVVSGVELVTMRSTLSLRIRSWATAP